MKNKDISHFTAEQLTELREMLFSPENGIFREFRVAREAWKSTERNIWLIARQKELETGVAARWRVEFDFAKPDHIWVNGNHYPLFETPGRTAESYTLIPFYYPLTPFRKTEIGMRVDVNPNEVRYRKYTSEKAAHRGIKDTVKDLRSNQYVFSVDRILDLAETIRFVEKLYQTDEWLEAFERRQQRRIRRRR